MTRDPKAFAELPVIRRGALVLGLTLVAGSTDAVSYLGLGRVFTANMTGNTVLLGVALAQRDAGAAGRSAAALGGFVIGAIAVGLAPERKGTAGGGAGAPDARRRVGMGPRPGWRSRPQAWSRTVSTALLAELGLLATLLGWWSVAGSMPRGAVQDGLIALAGTAMGVQSAAVAHLAVPGVATTYITGTWTGISTGVAAWLRHRAQPPPAAGLSGPRLQAAVVVVYLGGAVAGGFAHDSWGPAGAAVPLGVLALVVLAGGIPDV